MQKNITSKEVNGDDNIFGLSTTLLSKHIFTNNLYQFNNLVINSPQILRNTQALGHKPNPPHLPQWRRGDRLRQ